MIQVKRKQSMAVILATTMMLGACGKDRGPSEAYDGGSDRCSSKFIDSFNDLGTKVQKLGLRSTLQASEISSIESEIEAFLKRWDKVNCEAYLYEKGSTGMIDMKYASDYFSRNLTKAKQKVKSAPVNTPTYTPPSIYNPAPKAPSVPEKKIDLTQDERTFSGLAPAGGSGIARDSSGQPVTLRSKDEVIQYGVSRGYKAVVVDNAVQISSRNSGVVGFAESSKELVQTLEDQVGHMKSMMNHNSDDLELVLAIDYSGSMSNNIQSVISDLQKLVDSMSNITHSGRGVKIGIVTFGKPGKEKMNLQLTSNLSEVQATLATLLSRYSLDEHSIEPGEACYHGLACAADQIEWRSSNRQIILITDESSHELESGDTAYVSSTETKLQSCRVYPTIVRLKN